MLNHCIIYAAINSPLKRAWSYAFPGAHPVLDLWRYADFRLLFGGSRFDHFRVAVRRPLSLSWSRARISFCATITLALGAHPVRGKGRSPPDLQLSFVNLLSAQCADNGHEMKGGPCDRFHRTSIPSGPTQSPASEGPSQEFVENRKCEITDRGTVPDRAFLRICELAQAQGSRRLARGERAAQASHRHQRPRHSQNSHDPQPCVAPLSAWLCQERATNLGRGMPDTVGTAQSGEVGNGGVDDRSWVRRPPGRRWTADAGNARRSHCDDGASRFPRRRCKRFVERTLPHPIRRLRGC